MEDWWVSDGVAVIRPPRPGEPEVLVAGRDAEWERWLGPGAAVPRPVACIVVNDEVVGWVDYDAGLEWLGPDAVNVGYNVFASYRRRGYGARAVKLLLHRLAVEGSYSVATVLIHPDNRASLALARRTAFIPCGSVHGQVFLTRPVPPLTYTDGTVTIRRQHPDDLEAGLTAIDDEQIDWLWLPGDRERWEAMSPEEQRTHQRRVLVAGHRAFETGPKWPFSVDAGETRCVAYVDADLANPNAPAGEANISYASHPDHRRRGYVTRSVRLVLRFLADHTAVRRAHVVIDAENVPSLRVARAVGAAEAERSINGHGRVMVRHIIEVPPSGRMLVP